MVRRRWFFFGPRIEKERNIEEYLEEIRRTPSTVERETKRSLRPGWRDDTPVPTDDEAEGAPPVRKPNGEGGHHRADSIVRVAEDWHPQWGALPVTTQALWNLRFMGHARYTVPIGRLREYLARAWRDQLSNWEWVNIDFSEWPEEWKTA